MAKPLNDYMFDYYSGGAIGTTLGTITIVDSDTVTTGTATMEVSGKVVATSFTAPAMEGTDSTLMTLVNELGATTYSSGTQAESSSHYFNVAGTSVLYGTTNVVMTAEGTQSADRAVPFMVLTENH